MSKRAEITAKMRAGIAAGRWKPGEQLPTVYEVCEEFHTTTSTAVYGMRDLGALVDARQGTGYFVALDALDQLQDQRPRAVVEAQAALIALRDQLDRIIGQLAA